MPRQLTIVDYDPNWITQFEAEEILLRQALGQVDPIIEHVGSTAVPGLAAKPTIDVMIGLTSLKEAAQCIQPIVDLGYHYFMEAEKEIPERRYFKKLLPDGNHSHHLHLVEVGSAFWQEHLLFRDYLRAHPAVARAYERHKRHLLPHVKNDAYAYTQAKTDFIMETLGKAALWQRLEDQKAYYRARAAEYDEWFNRTGRYDRGAELNRKWHSEADEVRAALHQLAPMGTVLELAAGTGLWTGELIKIAQQITAVDASDEMNAINQAKHPDAPITFLQADLFNWQPDRQYDLVFFGFWLSHVPPEKLDPFLSMVAGAMKPGGRLFLVDSRRDETSSALNHKDEYPEDLYHERKLNDGRTYTIYKIFYEPAALQARLDQHGLKATVSITDTYFIYTVGVKPV